MPRLHGRRIIVDFKVSAIYKNKAFLSAPNSGERFCHEVELLHAAVKGFLI